MSTTNIDLTKLKNMDCVAFYKTTADQMQVSFHSIAEKEKLIDFLTKNNFKFNLVSGDVAELKNEIDKLETDNLELSNKVYELEDRIKELEEELEELEEENSK
jgi:predicted nuclease with TOPRIM domain